MQRRASRVPPDGVAVAKPGADPLPVEDAAALRALMARAAHENFPVAMRLLPASSRYHLRAIYGFARLTDSLGDEYVGDRSVALDWVEAQLDDLFAGTPRHPVFEQLAPTVEAFCLSRAPFDDLVAANRMDQVKNRYADWGELLDYCALSANPVGRLVLAVFEADTEERLAASDAVCSGLQILEHIQDVGEDARAGRVYLPESGMARFGCTIDDLLAPVAGPGLRRLVAHVEGRTLELLEAGEPLVKSLGGYARLAVAGFVAGGLAGLEAVRAADHEVLSAKRKAGRIRFLRSLVPLYTGGLRSRGGTGLP
ncbi:MAG: squalene synthase HpnC [bacterium]|nr:squalene synthase HpnC [bacterium]MDE0290839.1 squalene synthase HpnC [bacterium]MDE0438253.1 squalene synthase HpnC [bacterium]